VEYKRSQERERQGYEPFLLKCPSSRGVLSDRVDLNQSGVGTLAGHAVDNGQNINFACH